MKPAIYRFTLLFLLPLLFVSCTSTEFQSWEGRNSVVEGRGGARAKWSMGWTFGRTATRRVGFRSSESTRPTALLGCSPMISHESR